MKLSVLYRRVSTNSQELSMSAQEVKLASYANLRSFTIGADFTDEAVTGSKPFSKRPGGKALIAYVEQCRTTPRPVEHLLVAKLDRLGRNARDVLDTVDLMTKLGVAVHFVDNGGDSFQSGGPLGRLFLQILSAFAEFELANIKERTSTGMAAKRAKKEFCGGRTPPFGFDLHGTKLVLNEREQSIITEMRSLKSQGLTFNAIARWLNEKQIPTKSGLIGRWQTGNVQGVLNRAPHEYPKSSDHTPVPAPAEVA